MNAKLNFMHLYSLSYILLSSGNSQNQAAQYDSGGDRSAMESVLSLDDGRWLRPAEESCSPSIDMTHEDIMQLSNIRQPSPPPVLAHVHKDVVGIPPSKVADPRPGPARSSPDGICDSKNYQHLHIVSSNAALLEFLI